MRYPVLLAAFAVFTLLDALTTVVGLGVGLIELNPVVWMLGIPFWVLFRTLLLGSMLTVFFFGHKFLIILGINIYKIHLSYCIYLTLASFCAIFSLNIFIPLQILQITFKTIF